MVLKVLLLTIIFILPFQNCGKLKVNSQNSQTTQTSTPLPDDTVKQPGRKLLSSASVLDVWYGFPKVVVYVDTSTVENSSSIRLNVEEDIEPAKVLTFESNDLLGYLKNAPQRAILESLPGSYDLILLSDDGLEIMVINILNGVLSLRSKNALVKPVTSQEFNGMMVSHVDSLYNLQVGQNYLLNAQLPNPVVANLATCSESEHFVLNTCVPNEKTCKIPNGAGKQIWNGTSFGTCTLASCNSNYYASGNSCVAIPTCSQSQHLDVHVCVENQKACTIANGVGQSTWNGTSYEACAVTSCNSGYAISGNMCVPPPTCLPSEHLINGKCSANSSTFKKVSVGGGHTCAINYEDKVVCWGNNNYGQLGNNSTTKSSFPVYVSNLTGAKQIASGYTHSCAITSDDKVVCWGANSSGQLGNNSTDAISSAPVTVANLTGVKQLSAGLFHNCAITSDDRVACWGDNYTGALGDNSPSTLVFNHISRIPVFAYNLSGVKMIATGNGHSCAITTKDDIYCWGDRYRQPIDYSFTLVGYPVLIFNVPGVKQLALGEDHACVIDAQDKLLCWGSNSTGQLGNNSLVKSSTLIAVPGLDKVKTVSLGYTHSCAVTMNNSLSCWGSNGYGQLGNNSSVRSLVPVVSTLVGAKQFSLGESGSCAVNADEKLLCWGSNVGKKTGSSSSLSPVLVSDP